ncbi:hypothetical protein M8371_11680, partial [Klebsiella pneumoniae]|nr:hypothetical protein [Klebsiella pneumoniae]
SPPSGSASPGSCSPPCWRSRLRPRAPAALDRPLVALYGPSSPDFTPPLSHKARVIRLITGYHKVRKGDAAEGYHQSLIDITPERVLQELNELLAEKTEHEEA